MICCDVLELGYINGYVYCGGVCWNAGNSVEFAVLLENDSIEVYIDGIKCAIYYYDEHKLFLDSTKVPFCMMGYEDFKRSALLS